MRDSNYIFQPRANSHMAEIINQFSNNLQWNKGNYCRNTFVFRWRKALIAGFECKIQHGARHRCFWDASGMLPENFRDVLKSDYKFFLYEHLILIKGFKRDRDSYYSEKIKKSFLIFWNSEEIRVSVFYLRRFFEVELIFERRVRAPAIDRRGSQHIFASLRTTWSIPRSPISAV